MRVLRLGGVDPIKERYRDQKKKGLPCLKPG